MNETLEPDPEFTQHLEWQLRTELRRRARFGGSQGRLAGRSRTLPLGLLRLSALVLLSVLLGGAGMAAVGHYQGRDVRELAEARATLQLALSQSREQLAGEDLERTEARYSDGIVNEEALFAARFRLASHQAEVARRTLDVEEVRGSGRAPEDGLAAPLVGARDYVLLRLELSLREAAGGLDLAQRHLQRVDARVANGIVGNDELRRSTVDVTQAVLARELLVRQMELRARFLRGELTMRETDLLGAMEAARIKLDRARSRHSLAQENLVRTESLVEAGLVNLAELQAQRLQAEEEQGAVLLAELELEVLEAELSR